MTSANRIALILLIGAVTGCSEGTSFTTPVSSTTVDSTANPPSSGGGTTTTVVTSSSPSNNVMQITVNGSLCSASTTSDAGYLNKPCASVTLCQPGTTNCQTVSDVLVDTGSYGFRVFPSGTNADGSSYNLASLNLQVVQQSGKNVATCAQFMTGSALWGSVVSADVILASGGERASSIPIEIINSSYGGSTPSDCDGGQAANTPADAGFNGILGVGQWEQDCGTDCDPAYNSSVAATGITASYYPYYTCSGNSCSQALVSVVNQVANPVSAFPVNNNGLIFELPAISSGGAVSVNGSVVFGIGTGRSSNNTLSGSATVYYADSSSFFATIYNGTTYSDSSSNTSIGGSFIDSGSNSLFFAPPSGVVCCEQDSNGNILSTTTSCSSSSSSGWICSNYSGSAINESVDYSTGAPTSGSGGSVSFSTGNYYNLGSGTAMAFSNLGSADTGCASSNPCTFDWGLPFFFGRNVYVGFQKMSGENLSSQPYWAY